VGEPSASSDEPVQIGAVLDGRYRIDAVIGSGGMGRVYRAEHVGIGRPVAIKVLHTEINRNHEATTRFQREALASGRLDHPNIVAVTDFGVLEGVGYYLVMEALDGEPLGARLERGRLPWGEALVIISGVLAGLRHAHDRGVVHRDIKPDNIFLAKKEGATVVKILDFGIAKLYAGAGDDPATTRAGLTVGTPAYLSPEQAVGGAITPASDLYSTTCVMVEMITGRAPFEGKDPLALLTAHAGRPPPKLRDLAPDLDLPDALEALVTRGLVKQSSERIGSASDYLAAVQQILGIAAPGHTARGSQPAMQAASEPVADPNATVRVRGPALVVPTPVPDVTVASRPDTTVPDATVPDATTPSPARSRPALAAATRAVSLADIVEPGSKRWLVLGLIGLAVIAVAGISVAFLSRHSDDAAVATVDAAPAVAPDPAATHHDPGPGPARRDGPPPARPRLDAPPHAGPTAPPPPSPPLDEDDENVRYQHLVDELWKSPSCEARRKAIAKLLALGDPRAIDELKKARHWYHDRLGGLITDDYNECLTRDADDAIKKLAP
jgi:serine/threonine-protein kinase